MSGARTAIIALVIGGCSGGEKPPEPPPPAVVIANADAGAADAVQLQAADLEGVARATKKAGRPIDILLRSSPVPAKVSVDGTPVGVTPQVWIGETGSLHTFVFEAPGYAEAKFQFVPVSSGVLHPRLDPVIEYLDAGVPPPREVVPQQPPPPIIDVDAQPAPLAPIDAAVAPDASVPGLGPTP
jgi:hypothetical protein